MGLSRYTTAMAVCQREIATAAISASRAILRSALFMVSSSFEFPVSSKFVGAPMASRFDDNLRS
jgi:hypothetical protein